MPLWIERQDFAGIAGRLERLTLRNPRYAFGWYSLAYAYRRLGRPAVAAAAYEAYIELRPGDAEPHFGLGTALTEAGDDAAAIAAYRRYLELETDPARDRYVERARDEILRLGGELPSARQPGPVDPATRAAALIEAGRYASASALLDSAGADDGRAWILRARIALARGQLARAVAATRRALARAPSAQALEALAEVLEAAGDAERARYFRDLAARAFSDGA